MKVASAVQMATIKQASELAGASADSRHASPYLYWSFVLPLAALFDGGRKLFEKGKAIREAKKAEIREKGRREGQEKERERITRELEELEASGVTLPPAVAEVVLGKRSQDDS